jgi:hypothetical protein
MASWKAASFGESIVVNVVADDADKQIRTVKIKDNKRE